MDFESFVNKGLYAFHYAIRYLIYVMRYVFLNVWFGYRVLGFTKRSQTLAGTSMLASNVKSALVL